MALRLAPPLRACGGAYFFPRCGVVVSPRCDVPLDGPPATHTSENETWPETRFNYIVAGAFSPTPATQSITNMMTTPANVTPVQSMVCMFSGVIGSLHEIVPS
jgi:hypothetical protein